MLRKWFRKCGYYLEEHWGVVPYTPIMYLFLWGATFRIITEDRRPIRFEDLGQGVYEAWCAVGIVCPILMLVVWWLIRGGGRQKVIGTWLRFGVDTATFSYLLTFHIADARWTRAGRELTESHLFSRYLLASVLIFMGTIVFRDILAIALNSYKARGFRSVRQP